MWRRGKLKYKVVYLLMALVIIISGLTTILPGARASTLQNPQIANSSRPTSFPHVQGTQIVDGSGRPLVLRGAEIESGLDDISLWRNGLRLTAILNSTVFTAMVQDWKMNTLRLC